MSLPETRARFEAEKHIHHRATLKFLGVDGFDVYNPSIPFTWKGRELIYGRVERRGEWARSWVRLFEKDGEDAWSLVPGSMLYPLEDPYVQVIGEEMILGGTHVRKDQGKISTYYGYFYRGTDLEDLTYFFTGPDYMKDIRLVPLAGGKIGVFSRPRSEQIRKKYGSESVVGFTTVDRLEDLTPDVVANAPVIPGMFGKDEWGGCNQAYALMDGLIGIIGHACYKSCLPGQTEMLQTYMNTAMLFDPATHRVQWQKVIGTRPCYPEGPAKTPWLTDCCFSSGIVRRGDGKVDLFSGLGDVGAGRIVVDDPFEGLWP